MKKFVVTYRSRYYRFDVNKRTLTAPSKKWIRDNWHGIMLTDEYVIAKIEEASA